MKLLLRQSIRIADLFEIGLRAGNDIFSILQWMQDEDPDQSLRNWAEQILKELRLERCEQIVQDLESAALTLHERLLYQTIQNVLRGSIAGSEAFANLSSALHPLLEMKGKERALLFLPKFQACLGIAIVTFFVVVLPLWNSEQFFTFIHLGRADLYIYGCLVLLLGFVCIMGMCRLPSRHLAPLMEMNLHLMTVCLTIEGGWDFAYAWRKGVEGLPRSSRLRSFLSLPASPVESFDDYLRGRAAILKSPWPEILSNLLWVRSQGGDLSAFLKRTLHRQNILLLQAWDEQIRRMTMLTLVPLGFFIFLPCMYLIVGPQFLEIFNL